jgi:peptidoglycan hydrolase-like protein with peptidoglycan-binding domain
VPGTSILKSVGVGGVNRPDDVKTIQELLNLIPQLLGGPLPLLKVDGLVGPKTNGAIFGFQKKQFGPSGADGRVDPGQQTIQKIIDLLASSVGPNPPRLWGQA